MFGSPGDEIADGLSHRPLVVLDPLPCRDNTDRQPDAVGLHPEQLGRNAVHRRAVIRCIDRRKQRDDLVTVLPQHRLQRQRGILSSAPVENRPSPLLYHDSESIE